MKTRISNIDWSRLGIFLVLIIISTFFALRSPVFFSKVNLINVLRQVSIYGICSVGISMCLIAGCVDLSVGSQIGLASVLCATLITGNKMNTILACLIVVIVGMGIGAANAFFIVELRLAPFIATLGMMILVRGVTLLIVNGMPVYDIPEKFLFLGQGYLFGIPVPVIVMIIVFTIGYLLLHRTVFGKEIYGTGGNEEAARLSGVHTKLTRYKVFALSGGLASIAGVVLLSRINAGMPTSGQGYEGEIISACVLGGVSMRGGEGRILNVVVGVVFMGVLMNGMILLNISEYWQQVVKGAVIILAVALDGMTKKMKENAAVKIA